MPQMLMNCSAAGDSSADELAAAEAAAALAAENEVKNNRPSSYVYERDGNCGTPN